MLALIATILLLAALFGVGGMLATICIVFALGLLLVLCFKIWMKYDDWSCDREAKRIEEEYDNKRRSR